MKIKVVHTPDGEKEKVLFECEIPNHDDYVIVEIERDGVEFSISPNWQEGKDGIEIYRGNQDYVVELPSDDLVSLRHA